METIILKTRPDRKSEFYFNVISDGNVEMMIHRVIYGYRVRAGFVDSIGCEWDWCCGDNSFLVSITYGAVKQLLEHGVKFNALPGHSNIKPWNKDEEFIQRLNDKLLDVDPDIKLIELLKAIGLYQPITI